MPVNKNQLGRLLVIHGKLATMRPFSWVQLVEACESSDLVRERPAKRTIQDDIKLLQDVFNAPIPKWKSHYFYEKEFTLFEALNQDDAALLNESLALLRQFSALPQSDGLQEVLFKLETEAGLFAEIPRTVVYFEQNPLLKGLHFLNELYNYINCQQCVEIDYTDFKGVQSTFVIHPYFLKEYNNRWYLFGLEHVNQRIFNLALDRMNHLTSSDTPFQANEIIDPSTYFEHFIGVTNPQENQPKKVVLRVSKPRAWYVNTKPLHTSQATITETDELMEFSYQIIINKELESKILELGADCEVISPTSLRDTIREIVAGMSRRYQLG